MLTEGYEKLLMKKEQRPQAASTDFQKARRQHIEAHHPPDDRRRNLDEPQANEPNNSRLYSAFGESLTSGMPKEKKLEDDSMPGLESI